MAIKGLSFSEEEVFISSDDPAKTVDEGATVFWWRNIPSGVMARIQDMTQVVETEQMSLKQTYKTQHSQKHRMAVKWACKRIDNFFDKKNRPIDVRMEQIFEGGELFEVLSNATLDAIPLAIINEFGQLIIKTQALTEEQAKNSDALLSRFGALGTSDATSAQSENDSSADTTSKTSDTNSTGSESP